MKSHSCHYCNKYFKNPDKARECENNHDVVMIPLLREDLNRLVNFIASPTNEALLTDRLKRTLFRCIRAKSTVD